MDGLKSEQIPRQREREAQRQRGQNVAEIVLAGEHAQAADQRAEQRHADDDRRTRKDVDDGAGDGVGAYSPGKGKSMPSRHTASAVTTAKQAAGTSTARTMRPSPVNIRYRSDAQ